MDTLTLMRGLEDHPSSEDEVPKKSATLVTPRAGSNARARASSSNNRLRPGSHARTRKHSGGRLEPPRDPHDLIRGMTEDHWSSEEEKTASRPVGGGARARQRSIGAGARQRVGSASRERLPIGDPHDLVRGLTEDHTSSEDDAGSAPGTRKRLSSGAANRPDKPIGDPHDLIRGLTEDRWSSDEEEPAAKPSPAPAPAPISSSWKKPSLSVSKHRPSSTSRPDMPVGDPHDLIRGMTEDVWSSSDDEPAPSATRAPGAAARKSSSNSRGPLSRSPRKSSAASHKPTGSFDKKDGLAVKKPPTPAKSSPKTSPSVLPLLPVGPTSPSNNQPPVKVLFVCLGNICRSPMAHGILQYLTRPGLLPPQCPPVRVDSAGTGAYHALAPPDSRTMELLRMHGIKGFIHSARKIRAKDFYDFDYMLCMDAENLSDLHRRQRTLIDRARDQSAPPPAAAAAASTETRLRAPSNGTPATGRERAPSASRGAGRGEPTTKIQLFGEYGGNETEIVEDPYYGSNEGFDVAWEQVVRMAQGWIRAVLGFEADISDLLD